VTSNVLDNASRVVETWRIGTDGSAIRTAALTYDTLGRMKSRTDALSNVTTNLYSLVADGRSLTEERNPDLTTRKTYQNRDGSTERVVGTAVYGQRYTNWAASNIAYSRRIALEANESDTVEYVTSKMDFAGRAIATIYADGASATNGYSADGQFTVSTDPDGVTRLSSHDEVGQSGYSVIDLNGDREINLGGLDRVTRTVRFVTNNAHGNVQVSVTYAWPTNSVDSPIEVSRSESSTDGLQTWSMSLGRTNSTVTQLLSGGLRVTTQTAPDGSITVVSNRYGRTLSTTRRDASNNLLSQTTFGYDEHGRQKLTTNTRNGTSTNSYDALDRIVASATPAPASGQASQRTGYRYDVMGRMVTVTNADNTLLYNEYTAQGSRSKIYGSRTYPVEYTYDYAGRMKTMKTWQDYAGNSGTALTTWNYDGNRGFMTNKVYADGKGPGYSYSPGGRLQQRVWARGITTTYHNNIAGDLSGVSYSDSTPGVTNLFDRLGRKTSVGDAAGEHAFLFDERGLVLSETNVTGLLSGLAVTNAYDLWGRRTALGLSSDTTTLVKYGYDGASRLSSVTNGVQTIHYSRIANSPLISQIEFKQSGTTRMTTTKSFDYLNRLTLITNAASASGSENPAFAYANNSANQRTSITNADGSRWVYSYDALGQVTSGRKYWSDGTPVAGQQFDYAYDDIGNRRTADAGGDVSGTHLRRQTYAANSLNQYTSRTVPGRLDVQGTATNIATVTVNHSAAARKGSYYRGEVSVLNSSSAVWQPVTNIAVLASGTNDYVTNTVGHAFIPKTPETFGYDADGNMTNDGRWALTWDAENRLTKMESLPGAPAGSSNRLSFVYDHQGRRVSKAVQAFVSGTWSITLSNRFLYDGWNLVAELNATNKAVMNGYVWGLDLSGSLQGAGGVGGLLALTVTNSGSHFAGFDGNGNVAVLVSASGGTVSANYEYDPFGRVLRSSGALVAMNPFRFSTKYTDGESGFNYYGYRYYNAETGRWPNRDPLGRKGGNNIYAFVNNYTPGSIDMLGLKPRFILSGCELIVSWKFDFSFYDNGLPPFYDRLPENAQPGFRRVWTWENESQKEAWKAQFKRLAEGYFSGLPYSCVPCIKKGGCARYSVKFLTEFSTDVDATRVEVYKPGIPDGDIAGSANRQRDVIRIDANHGLGYEDYSYSNGSSMSRFPILHEIGHLLGLDHPGQSRVPPNTPNSQADYVDPENPTNLMGQGWLLTPEHFQQAFCEQIKKITGYAFFTEKLF
jgi:RHS repeat-associated protein